MKCDKCGQKYSIWSSKAPGGILCDDCWKNYPNTDIEKLVNNVVLENEDVIHFGAAYWDTKGTNLGSFFAKIMFGFLSGKEHRAGIIGITKQELILVDMDVIVGEDFSFDQLLAMAHRNSQKIKRIPIQELDLSTNENPDDIRLSISGSISVEATFLDSIESGNAAKAIAIATFASTSAKQ